MNPFKFILQAAAGVVAVGAIGLTLLGVGGYFGGKKLKEEAQDFYDNNTVEEVTNRVLDAGENAVGTVTDKGGRVWKTIDERYDITGSYNDSVGSSSGNGKYPPEHLCSSFIADLDVELRPDEYKDLVCD